VAGRDGPQRSPAGLEPQALRRVDLFRAIAVNLRPIHLRLSYLAAVWLGGTLGTGCRYLIGRAMSARPAPVARAWFDEFPLGTFLINIIGAFVLGVLLERLAHAGADRGRRRLVRLLAGTGFLGGFTTYSALATDTVGLVRDGRLTLAVGYALGTALVGVIAAYGGVLVAARRRPRGRAR
jgi:fluoride exporter